MSRTYPVDLDADEIRLVTMLLARSTLAGSELTPEERVRAANLLDYLENATPVGRGQ